MAIEGLAADTDLLAQIGDNRSVLAQGGLRQPQLRRRHLRLAAAVATSGSRGSEPSNRALADQFALKLGKGSKDAKDQLAGGGSRVDRGALTGQHPKADVSLGQIVHDVNEVAQAAAEPIKFPHDERVGGSDGFEATLQARAVVELTACRVAVEVALGDTGVDQRVPLQVEDLGAVGFRHPHVADESGKGSTPQTVVFGVFTFGIVFR